MPQMVISEDQRFPLGSPLSSPLLTRPTGEATDKAGMKAKDDCLSGLCVSSWNVWGIPLVSPNFLSRVGEVGLISASMLAESIYRNSEQGIQLSANRTRDGQTPKLHVSPNDDVVMCFQEVWSFRVGLARPLCAITAALERRVPWFRRKLCNFKDQQSWCAEVWRMSSILTIITAAVSVVQGWLLPFCCWPFLWDPKKDVVSSLRGPAAPIVGLNHAVGVAGASMGRWYEVTKLLDSGLLIVASKAPLEWGFVAYQDQEGEKRANKGLLWALLPRTRENLEHDGRCAYLVVNTHLSAEGDGVSRMAQMRQLKEEILRVETVWQQRFWVSGSSHQNGAHEAEDNRRHLDGLVIVVCGDFNIPKDSKEFELVERFCDDLSLRQMTDNGLRGTCADSAAAARDEEARFREIDFVFCSDAPRLPHGGSKLPPLQTSQTTRCNDVGWHATSDHGQVAMTNFKFSRK